MFPSRDAVAVLIATFAILATHAVGLGRLLPLLPAPATSSRSPSSDVLMGALPLTQAADRLGALDRQLPASPGVIVAHAPADAVTPAYMVIAMHLWPRPVSLVTCQPAPGGEQFSPGPGTAEPTWRIDLRPGARVPLAVGRTRGPVLPAVLCEAGEPR